MLRDAGVRTKLLAVLAIPTVLLVVVTGLLVQGQVSAARRAGQVNDLTDVAIQVNRVVHSLQEERSATLGYLQDPNSGNQASMQGQRRYTNQQLRILRSLVAASSVDQMSDKVQEAIARSASGHDELRGARRSVDAGRFFATETDVFYSRIIRADLDLPGVVASSATTDLATRLEGYEALSSAIEYSAHERDLVELALLRGLLTEADFATSSALVAQERQALADVQRNVPASTYLSLDNALAGAANSEIDQVRRSLPDLIKGREPNFGRSVEWLGAANSRIGPMTEAETRLVSDIAVVASDTQNRQEQRSLLLVFAAVIGLGLALMLAVSLARRITRPLRRLTVAAGEIGDELPHMVERMQTPGEGPGVVVEPIPVESADEIGRLAVAFNTVNDVTIQVAKEQAALRSSIAEMFVNVARRNQVLLGRQLSQLDAMESREEDPDVLDNLFKLDHLATRMRRNAESLLVLAGIDSSRRLRRGLPLSDVIRTAVGEIESYDRIDLSMTEDPEVSGRHALTVAHLLAELLENATHFSNPETRVVLAAAVTGHGVDVTITDYGLGMSEDEVAEANAKIAHPPVAEIAVSQRLGLFVVGRLASRLDAGVVLRRGRTAGTVVVVSLPASVFEGMTVAEPITDEPTPEQTEASAPVAVQDALDAGHDVPAVEDSTEPVGDELAAEVIESSAQPRWRGLFGRRRKAARAPEVAAQAAVEAVAPETAALLDVDAAGPDLAEHAESEPVEVVIEPRAADAVSVTDDVEPEPVDVDSQLVSVVTPEPEPVPAPVVEDVSSGPEPVAKEDSPEPELVAQGVARAVEDGTPEREPAAEVVSPEPEAVAEHVTSEPEPVAEVVSPEPEPVDEDGTPADEPVTEDVAPTPEPAPQPAFAYAPAVTILPGNAGQLRSRRFGRRRGAAPTPPSGPAPAWPQPVASLPVPPAPVAPPPARVAPEPSTPPPAPNRTEDLFAPPAQRVETADEQSAAPPRDAPVPVMNRPADAPVPGTVGSLPGRTPKTPTPSGPGRTSGGGDLDRAAIEAQMHSSALSELRGLYEPTFAPTNKSATGTALSRRTPKAAEADSVQQAPADPAPVRSRDAAQVRGMLSGFRAGVARGRDSASDSSAEATSDDHQSAPTR